MVELFLYFVRYVHGYMKSLPAKDVRFYALFVQRRPVSHMYSHISSAKKQLQCSKTPYSPD